MRRSVLAFVLVGIVLPSLTHAYDPRAQWKTLKTPHFHIHYAEDQEHWAQTTAQLAERIHTEISPQLSWQPASPTDIIVADDSDFANGQATPWPYNQIHLRISPPEPGGFMEVSDVNDWLYQLIRHEYAHILHLDANSRAPAFLQKIIGRQWFTFPALFQPSWVIEGLATDIETDSARGVGRGVGSDMAMHMRSEVMHGLKPLNQVSLQMMDAWPRGYGAYIYGVHFFQFLRERYGEDSAQRMIKNYRGNLIPFRINQNARLTTGKPSMAALWTEFHGWLNERYQPQIDSLRHTGVHEGKQLSHGGQLQSASSLQATPDGSVYYVRGSTLETAALMHRMPNGETKKLSVVHGMARFDVHPRAGIVIAQPEQCGSDRLYFDLYWLAPGSTTPRRLTHCARYRQVVWRPDGQGFIAAKEESGHSRIDRLALDGSLEQTLWNAADNERATQLTISPDGTRLVFVYSKQGEGSDLMQLELATGTLKRLSKDRNSEVEPRFTPDGSALLFSSDHGGVRNLRRLDIASGTMTTLSNTLTGAFSPSQGLNNGPIWYRLYTSQGHELARLDTGLTTPVPAAIAADPRPVVPTPGATPIGATPYRAWNSLRPRSWFPILQADNARTLIGAATSGSDALSIHTYSVALARDVQNDAWSGGLAYTFWDRLLLSIATNQSVTLNGDQVMRVRNVDSAALGLQLPWLRYETRFLLSSGLVWEKRSDHWRMPGLTAHPDRIDGVAGIAGSLATTLPVPDSAGPTAGRKVQLLWETSNALGRNDYSGHTIAADWREYLDLSHGRVLAVHLAAARGDPDIKPYALGGSFNDVSASAALPFNRRSIDLRSYDDDTLVGHAWQLATVELRSPLWSLDRTLTSPPLGLTHVHGSVFAESARALGNRWSEWYSGVGTEAIAQVVLGYHLPIDLRAGVAWGLNNDANEGGARAWLSLGYGF